MAKMPQDTSAGQGGSSAVAPTPAILVLEDGLVLHGRSVGVPGTALGEMVFTTSMSGYQEAATDPSYRQQILTFAAPMIGNYGAGPGFDESDRVHPEAIVMACAGDRGGAAGPTGWCTWLREHGVIAIDAVDTRRLVTHLRDHGALRGAVSTELGASDLVDRVRAHPVLDGRDLVTDAAGPARQMGTTGPAVVAIDCGMKASIATRLANARCRLTVVPAGTSADTIRQIGPDAVFVSNGPGDPAAAVSVIETLRVLVGTVPIFGICMGHQLLARAMGLETEKLPFGHRGANHPVRRTDDGGVEITVQNHGYAVSADRLPEGIVVTRTSLFDGSVEGIAVPELRAWSVQYHPEARPGPHDAGYLFDRFVAEVSA
jgi:carbamoyl-phosphate synthase small subunit